MIVKSTTIECDEITQEIAKSFDFPFTGTTITNIKPLPALPHSFSHGLIVGPSGSGKSTLLDLISKQTTVTWDNSRSIAAHFESVLDAQERLSATGLNSIPAWCRPFSSLSNGEQFRATLARQLGSNVAIDEFTSVVDRSVAKSCSAAIARYIGKKQLTGLVFASCHYDIIDWLNPEWVYDTATEILSVRGAVQRPAIELEMLPCTTGAWAMFRNHHYLSADINKSSRCWIASWEGIAVGFASALAYPSGTVKNAWRGHRTVVTPDFQGLGFGVRISDCVGTIMISEGKRYFSKTAHPRMGGYRDNSNLWRMTSKNGKVRHDYKSGRKTKESNYKHLHADRRTWSHEFMGVQ